MMRRIKSFDELSKDKVYRYIGNGFRVYDKDGSHTVSVNAEYDCKIVGIYSNHVTLRLKADQSTITRMCIWDSIPYNWSITKYDLQNGIERLYEEVYE